MPLAMNREVFITCRHHRLVAALRTAARMFRVQPRADCQKSAIDAAKAGAAIVHCHVRDPETGKPSPRSANCTAN